MSSKSSIKQYIVIPARYASSRLPGKPLALIDGVPMILHVVRRLATVPCAGVVVAVDDDRVAKVVRDAGFNAILTDVEHTSGSDRVLEAALELDLAEEDVVVNVQGDEPLIPAENVQALITHMASHARCEMATLCEPISTSDFLDSNVVKVVRTDDGQAMYFSRAPIPFPRDSFATTNSREELTTKILNQTGFEHSLSSASRHVGVYAFRLHALRTFSQLGPGKLEQIEMLEQLRWLQAGRQIDLVNCVEPSAIGVDTEADRLRVEQILQSDGPGADLRL